MFPSELTELRNINNPTVLFCGAGLSIGAVPGAKDLYENDYKGVEQHLGLSGSIDHGKFTGFSEEARLYAWADEVLAELDRRKEPLPKLRFAEALGLLDDPRWWGRSEIDFRGNTPRHRVMARFAKEGLWHSIWSFNWDCIIENTLEQIGLPDREPRFDSPWKKSHYNTHVHSVYFPCSKHPKALNIHKPHGCVRALREAKNVEGIDQVKADELSYRLMVGKKELHDRSAQPKALKEDRLFSDIIGSEVAGSFNLAVGWSMSEQSLKQEIVPNVSVNGTMLAVVDPSFSLGHLEICKAAGLQQDDVYFQLECESCPNRDDFFLWQQALYTLDRLEAQNGNSAIVDMEGESWRSTALICDHRSFFKDWADEFLPTWTRLCWSAGLVTALKMPSHRIDLERRDEHVPLGYDHVKRPDLEAAISILNAIPALGDGFDAGTFPGGLFHEETSTLVIPLPCWGELNELRALRPLLDELREKLGYVRRLEVWPIGELAGSMNQGDVLRDRLASIMVVPSFADPGNIRVISNLSEVGHGSD